MASVSPLKPWEKCNSPDNYQQHVYLHATPDRKGKRTKFDVKAVAEVAAWEEAKAHSRQEKSSFAAKVVKRDSRRNKST